MLSVIVPAYNTSAWIVQCLDSIIAAEPAQSHELEVVVVNDGSTDNTADILANYCQKHSEVRVITQENQGLSGARNTGLKAARGRYVAFVDSDDRWADDIYLPWNEIRKGTLDIIGLDIVRQKHDGGQTIPYRRYKAPYGSRFANGMDFLKGRNLLPCVIGYIYRRAFLIDNGLYFASGLYHEDEDFTTRVFLKAGPFMAVKGPHYVYVERQESITTSTDKARQRKRIGDLLIILNNLRQLPNNECERIVLKTKLSFLTLDTVRLMLSFNLGRDFEQQAMNKMKEMGLYPFAMIADLHYLLLRSYLSIRLLLRR
ncbi:MAG: glycosyltransferase [Bacteroidales bacterium]|nr:glycosyltransferase [Candidatus Liminaster caballi]